MSSPEQLRLEMRAGRFTGPTRGLAPGWMQANLAAVPASHADDFLAFCRNNARACPIIDVTDIGDPVPSVAAPGADLSTDLPKYRVFEKNAAPSYRTEVSGLWGHPLVGFLLGCSFTFERALVEAGIRLSHTEEAGNVPMFKTNRECAGAGPFRGPLVVSMRPVQTDLVALATEITSRYPLSHGAPIHVGDPGLLGIDDLMKPDFGDPQPLGDDEAPMFWACGVTPQEALAGADLPLAVAHAPGHMFITDLSEDWGSSDGNGSPSNCDSNCDRAHS